MKTKVRIIKVAVITFLLLNVWGLCAQEQFSVNITQDAKLLFAGDEKGNAPGTINLTIRSEWRGKQQAWGFMFVAPEFEYADLNGGIYRRYSANVGYTFQLDRVFATDALKNVQATSSIGIGTIDYNGGYYSLGSNFQLGYQLTNFLVLFVDLELVDRKDLQYYETEKLKFGETLRASGKFGLKINI